MALMPTKDDAQPVYALDRAPFLFAERQAIIRAALYAQGALDLACARVTMPGYTPPDDEKLTAAAYRRRVATYRPRRER